jgi:hypothetical protein
MAREVQPGWEVQSAAPAAAAHAPSTASTRSAHMRVSSDTQGFSAAPGATPPWLWRSGLRGDCRWGSPAGACRAGRQAGRIF